MSKPLVNNLRVVITSEDTSNLAAGPIFDVVKAQDTKDQYLIGVIYQGEEVYYRLDMTDRALNSLYWDTQQDKPVDIVYQHPNLGKRYFHFYRAQVL